jgi:hypothetical protein
LKIHHHGRFSPPPGRTYGGGLIKYVDFLKPNEFGYDVIVDIMFKLNYLHIGNMSLFFKKPTDDLDTGLIPLRDDPEDVAKLTAFIGTDGVREIELYVVLNAATANTATAA